MLNDQFFTQPVLAEICVSRLNIAEYPTIIEPSCGTGSFLQCLPKRTIGIELDKTIACPGAVIGDFFDYKPCKLKSPILVIGNPPFGKVSSLAIQFFNHATTFADTIAFIVPATFLRVSVTNRLSLDFRCKHSECIPKGSFQPRTMQARCVFQIWQKSPYKRKRIKIQKSSDFWPCARKDADIALKAYGGSGDCGTIIPPNEARNPRAYHFLKLKTPVIKKRLELLDYYPLAGYTVRQDSIGLSDLYYLYKLKYPAD
jgi:hypothetical protein